jgi:hypothetical protein
MSDLKLYEVACSVNFYIEVEAGDEDEAKTLAENHLTSSGVYDITVSTSPISIEEVKEVL